MARKPKNTIVMDEKDKTEKKTNKKSAKDAEKELFKDAPRPEDIEVKEIDPSTGELIEDGDDEECVEIEESNYSPKNLDELLEVVAALYERFKAGEQVNLGMISLQEYDCDELNLQISDDETEHYDVAVEFFDGIEDWDVSMVTNFTGCFSGYKNFNKSLLKWKIREDAELSSFADRTGYGKVYVEDILTIPDSLKIPRTAFIYTDVLHKHIRRVAR